MTSHQHLRQLFDRALDVPPADRARFLAEACGGDEALRLRLLAMLCAADDEHFLGAATSPGSEPAGPEAVARLKVKLGENHQDSTRR